MRREFNAPRAMVFDAMTKPELPRRWLSGPDGWRMTVCEVDLRVGGRFRYVWGYENSGGIAMGYDRPAAMLDEPEQARTAAGAAMK